MSNLRTDAVDRIAFIDRVLQQTDDDNFTTRRLTGDGALIRRLVDMLDRQNQQIRALTPKKEPV